jgi:hypothetical protein
MMRKCCRGGFGWMDLLAALHLLVTRRLKQSILRTDSFDEIIYQEFIISNSPLKVIVNGNKYAENIIKSLLNIFNE